MSIKQALSNDQEPVIGAEHWGHIFEQDGTMFALRHSRWRHRGNDYTQRDLVPIFYHLKPIPYEKTHSIAYTALEQMRDGVTPHYMTTGVEIEGSFYKQCAGVLFLANRYPHQEDIDTENHPELLDSTIETTTEKEGDHYPIHAAEIVRQLSHAVLHAHRLADNMGGFVVHTSAPEAGNWTDARITKHPYLEIASLGVLEDTLKHGKEVPQETLDLYRQTGISNIFAYLENTGILNWPTQSMHVHSGLPFIEGKADSRIALTMAYIRNSLFAKLASFVLYGTPYIYGVRTDYSDTRSIIRRLLHTTHDASIPDSMEAFASGVQSQITHGDIHSPDRFPANGQHSTIRMRANGTLESIDAAMHPDLRADLSWIFLQQIMNTMALEYLEDANGNETLAMEHMRSEYGKLLSIIPQLGNNSSFSLDLLFHKHQWDARTPLLNNHTFAEGLQTMLGIILDLGQRYPAIATQAKFISAIFVRQYYKNGSANNTIERYMGCETGEYIFNGANIGPLTPLKIDRALSDIELTQSALTRLQAESFSKVRDDKDVLNIIGLS